MASSSKPGSTAPRGASPPYARPLADRPGPEGVTLQVPGRSTMDRSAKRCERSEGAEASTDQRRIQAKKKTTFAKLNREAAVRERQQLKQARRAARKLEAQTRSGALNEPVLAEVVVEAPKQ